MLVFSFPAVQGSGLDALHSLALIETSLVLLERSCVLLVFPHQIIVQILDHITARSFLHLGGTVVRVDAGRLEESRG